MVLHLDDGNNGGGGEGEERDTSDEFIYECEIGQSRAAPRLDCASNVQNYHHRLFFFSSRRFSSGEGAETKIIHSRRRIRSMNEVQRSLPAHTTGGSRAGLRGRPANTY